MLRLLENFNLEEVQSAVKDALRLGALSFDAVKHLVLCRLGGRPPRLDLELYPYLPRVSVKPHIRQGLHDLAVGEGGMNDRPTLLLEHHLKELRLPSFLREYGKMAAQCVAEGVDQPNLSVAAGRTGTHRPPPADGATPHPGGPPPLRQEPGTPSTSRPSHR